LPLRQLEHHVNLLEELGAHLLLQISLLLGLSLRHGHDWLRVRVREGAAFKLGLTDLCVLRLLLKMHALIVHLHLVLLKILIVGHRRLVLGEAS
jgi:hypothetical protein